MEANARMGRFMLCLDSKTEAPTIFRIRAIVPAWLCLDSKTEAPTIRRGFGIDC